MFNAKTALPRLSIPGIFLAALLCCGALAQAAPTTVTLLIGDNLDEQGRPKPLSSLKRKLLDALERELGISFELRMYPWARAERYAIEGGGLIFGLPKSADRLHALRYSSVAAYNNLWLVTRSDATFAYNSIADLRGRTVGAVRGYSYGEEFDNARGKMFRTDEDIASRGTRLMRLVLKRVDVVLLFQPSTQTAKDVEGEIRTFMEPRLKTLPPEQASVSFSVLPKPMSTDSGVYFAIARSKDDGIIDRINTALVRIHQREEDGKRQRASGSGPN